jgi:hypothetical protein
VGRFTVNLKHIGMTERIRWCGVMRRLKTVFFVIIFSGTSGVAYASDLISNEKASEQIMLMIASVEPTLPQEIDSMTSLVAVGSFGVRGFEYKYVLGMTKDQIVKSTGLKLSALKAAMRVGKLKGYCEEERMYWFRDNFVEMKWAYVDVNNQELFAYRVNPNDC